MSSAGALTLVRRLLTTRSRPLSILARSYSTEPSAGAKRPRSEPPVCAPSKNLNTGFPHFATAAELYAHIREITQPGGELVVRNFVGVIEDVSVKSSTVETELFPLGALEYYTKKNMGWEYTQEESDLWQLVRAGRPLSWP